MKVICCDDNKQHNNGQHASTNSWSLVFFEFNTMLNHISFGSMHTQKSKTIYSLWRVHMKSPTIWMQVAHNETELCGQEKTRFWLLTSLPMLLLSKAIRAKWWIFSLGSFTMDTGAKKQISNEYWRDYNANNISSNSNNSLLSFRHDAGSNEQG